MKICSKLQFQMCERRCLISVFANTLSKGSSSSRLRQSVL